jgi:hypothetical protein
MNASERQSLKHIEKGSMLTMSKTKALSADHIDDLLLQEIFSLREQLKIAVEAIKSLNPDFDDQEFVHRLKAVDYEQLMEEIAAEMEESH